MELLNYCGLVYDLKWWLNYGMWGGAAALVINNPEIPSLSTHSLGR